MNKWAELLIGLIFLIAAVAVSIQNYYNLGSSAVTFFKGGLVWAVGGLGALLLLLGISDLKG
ncbi:MAG: hypothetical protein AABW65_01540 [Nanoarchaeota archaeon]